MALEILIYQPSEEKKIKKIFLGGGAFLDPQKLTFLKNSPLKDRAKIFLVGVLDSSHGPLQYEKKNMWVFPQKIEVLGGCLIFKKTTWNFMVRK